MGKKSRLKRQRKAVPPNKKNIDFEQFMSMMTKASSERDSLDFEKHITSLIELFRKFNAEDVLVSLEISDLWLPNISSPAKHQIALSAFASIDESQFVQSNRLDTYEKFKFFMEDAYKFLPSMGMLEDYVPTPDWGAIRLVIGGEYKRMFFGGCVERISDFIEAFRLSYEDDSPPLHDMELALQIQNQIISCVGLDCMVDDIEHIQPGHIEVPDENFWLSCREALHSCSQMLLEQKDKINPKMSINLGESKKPGTWGEFGNAFSEGEALPTLVINVGCKPIPVSIRNLATVVIDCWSRASINEYFKKRINLTEDIAQFLSLRIPTNVLFSGPLVLTSRTTRLPYMFSAVIQSDGHFYFILPLDIDEIKEVRKIEIDLLQLLSSDTEWGILRNPLHGGGVQLRRNDGKYPKLEDITVLAVLSSVVTTTMSLGVSSARVRVVPLPDFITLFDSFEDSHELAKFWRFLDSNEGMTSSPFSGLVDQFAAFRDSDAVLIGGAITQDLFLMDPHWGAEWRYRILSEFWQAAPLSFLDDNPTWIIKSVQKDDPKYLISKSGTIVDWCTLVNNCTIHFAFDISHQELDRGNGHMLELVTQCLADAFSQRKTLIQHLDLFSKRQVVIMCRANTQALTTQDFSAARSRDVPLLSNWHLLKSTDEFNLRVSVDINLTMVREGLESPSNAIFEAECTVKALIGLMAFVSDQLDLELSETLYKTGERVPRFLIEVTERKVDTPDFSIPIVPMPEHYKIARREIAIILKDLNFLPGRYELETAKTMIDPARDAFRSRIHEEIGVYDQHVLARFCVEQHEALMAKYHRDIKRVELSQRHEVSFDRTEAFAGLTRDFRRESKNYRYLLECCLTMATSGKRRCTEKDVVRLLASIDWLFVFYYASDAIHNNIDIVGLEIENDYIPNVFYSEDRDHIEQAFELEKANTNLGLGIQSSDAVYSSLTDDFNELDSAFILDVGFSFTQLSQMFYVLSKWPSMQGKSELLLSYQASTDEIATVLKKVIEDELTDEQSKKLLDFITLNANTIRCLAGKSINESDVPVWEHFKRTQRYTIKPLIKMEDGSLVWGAATVDKSRQIWWGQFISNGYLPADFEWPNVKKVVENIHTDTDKQLEITALDVCKRTADYVIGNIDFKNRFPKENFDDVGDFDVLVYWPNTNIWLIGECKNNQPPHCIKDARRLREQIFGGRNSKRAQLHKIERRRNFLRDHLTHIRELLKWPAPTVGEDAVIVEVYISRNIYWWMRNHPYQVPTEFVRVDLLASWLQEKDFS